MTLATESGVNPEIYLPRRRGAVSPQRRGAMIEPTVDQQTFESATGEPGRLGGPESDEGLLRRIAVGDRDAFHRLYLRYSGRVLAMLRHLCRGDRTPVEDLLQEAFLAIWRKAASYDASRGDAAGWLFTICRNKAIDLHRRRPPTEELDAAEPGSRGADPPTERTPGPISRDLRISLGQALANLSDGERRALLLAYYGGYTYEEAAHHLAIPLGTLKSRLRSGLGKIRKTMTQ
ncbi:MAG: sigma-70 family RNA polymerase sigma factor [Acidobacteriota bacterium]